MKVSFVIPVYNELHYTKQVRDIVSKIKSEVIFINDGSNDGTKEFLDSIKSKNVKVVHQQNKGVNASWNTGILLATGENIFVINNDVIFDKKNIDALCEALKTYTMVSPTTTVGPDPFNGPIRKNNIIGGWFRGFKREDKYLFYPIIEECKLWFGDDYIYRKITEKGTFAWIDTKIHHFESITLKKFSEIMNPVIVNDAQVRKTILKREGWKDPRFSDI